MALLEIGASRQISPLKPRGAVDFANTTGGAMKKLLACLAIVGCFGFIAACGEAKEEASDSTPAGEPTVAADTVADTQPTAVPVTNTPEPQVPTATPQPPPPPPPTQAPQPTAPIEQPTQPPAVPPPAGNCDPSYPTVCIPPRPPDLSCADVLPATDFTVLPPDPHGFDGNEDGIGCES